VAIDLSQTIRQRLGELIARLSEQIPGRSVRWVKSDSIHLTLKFLGDVSSDGVSQAAAALRRVAEAHPPLTFRVQGLGCFPNARRPRVLWIGVHEKDGRLASLHEAIEIALDRLGYKREIRAFSPHLTLGRVRDEAVASGAQGIAAGLAALSDTDLGTVEVSEVCLFQSELRPTGAIYTALERAALRGQA
jgi:2'-5' RNA ligase